MYLIFPKIGRSFHPCMHLQQLRQSCRISCDAIQAFRAWHGKKTACNHVSHLSHKCMICLTAAQPM